MKIQYRAINASGKPITGTLAADSERAAIRSLRRQGLSPVDVQTVEEKKAQRLKRKPKRGEVVLVMRQLAVLMQAGVALDTAIASLADTVENGVIASEFETIVSSLRRGETLSTALATSSLALPDYAHQLVRAGELTGQLPKTLDDAVTQMEYDLRTAGEIRNALLYPAILIFSGIAAVMLMFVLVVPKFTKLLQKSDAEVPLLGRLVLETGQFFNDNIMLVGGIVVALIVSTVTLMSKPQFRARGWDAMARLPLIGPWLREADTGRWATMMATLLKSRVELTQALELARMSVVGEHLRANLSQVTKSVKSGSGLAEALKNSGAITPTGFGLIDVGQRSGELPTMLQSLASLYEEGSKTRMKRFLTVLEPMAILMIGGIIGLIMTGIMLAITSVHDVSL